MVQNISEFDIIVVGGGIVGATAACVLSRQYDRIALIDYSQHIAWQRDDPFGLRVSAINPGSRLLLNEISAWDEIESMRAFPYQSMIVWEEAGEACIEFNANETSHSSLGTIVENQVVLTALDRVIAKQKNITRFEQCALQDLSAISDSSMLVEMENGERISARLVIGADGQNSRVRECVGISSMQKNYQQAGVVCNVRTELPHQNTARQCFTRQGPLALLPLEENVCSIVWSVSIQRRDELLALGDAAFSTQLSDAFERRLGCLQVLSERKSFALQGAQSQRYVDHRVVLMGDAAHVVHPLAGLGLNLGLEDVRCLSSLLRSSSRPLGSERVLRKYERERRSSNLLMQRSLEAIDALFRNQHSMVKSLRTLGVTLTNRIVPLKLLFMQRAMGVTV